MTPALSIVIVNYNGGNYLAECLKSVEKYAQCPHEVIVVDNASTDGSCEYLRENFPYVRLIESKMNLGFSGGNNLGAAHVKGDLLLLLNNDTCLMSSLSPAIKEFEANRQLGVLGCKTFYGDGSLQLSIGFDHTPTRMVLSWSGFGRFVSAPAIFKRVDNNKSHYNVPHEAAWISGAFLMTRKELWVRLGGFDDKYFMYVEDVDYCKRVRMAGYKVAFTPLVEMIHYEGGGKKWIGEKALRDSMESYFFYLKKFYNNGLLICFVRLGLGLVMMTRASAFYILTLFSKSNIKKQKARAYRDLSLNIFHYIKANDE